MIKSLIINKYRKLEDIEIELGSKINIISGSNGTCKSSILYLVSNAFQGVKQGAPWVSSKEVIKNLNKSNTGINLKIERLTRGDDRYNDPAPNEKGTLFSCRYEDGVELEFRRHNTRENDKNRFALKPRYNRGSKERLPEIPVIYLGLSRLFAFGEYNNDDIRSYSNKLPKEYIDIIDDLYSSFTGLQIDDHTMQIMGG